MNMPIPQGQPPQQAPQGPQGGSGNPPGQAQGSDNPLISCIKMLGEFVQRLAQRDPAKAKAAGKALQDFIAAVQGGSGEAKPGSDATSEEQGNPESEQAAQDMKPKKKSGPLPMNARPGAVQVL